MVFCLFHAPNQLAVTSFPDYHANLTSPIYARYVRITILQTDCTSDEPVITAELHGCSVPGIVSIEEVR